MCLNLYDYQLRKSRYNNWPTYMNPMLLKKKPRTDTLKPKRKEDRNITKENH